MSIRHCKVFCVSFEDLSSLISNWRYAFLDRGTSYSILLMWDIKRCRLYCSTVLGETGVTLKGGILKDRAG